MKTYTDLRIAPFTGLLDSPKGGVDHQGGPDFPDWENETASRHCRYGYKPMDLKPLAPKSEPIRISGEFAYLGPASHHFGHQIADFSTRILATKRSGFRGHYVFGGKPSLGADFEAVPDFQKQIVDYFGLPRERIRLVSEESRLESVLIAPQAEPMFSQAPTNDYLDGLEANFHEWREREARPSSAHRHKIVYISRSRLTRGIFAGELAIEDFMRRSGALIIYPELERLADLLQLYASAEYVVGAEGSAFHAMQLLGKQLPNIVVIRRRDDSRMFGEPFLRVRSRSFALIDAVIGGITDSTSGRYRETGLTGLSFEKLREGLRTSLPVDVSDFSEAQFKSGISSTISIWLSRWWARLPNVSLDGADTLRREVSALGAELETHQEAIIRSKLGPPLNKDEIDLALQSIERSGLREVACKVHLVLTLAVTDEINAATLAEELLENPEDLNADELGELARVFWDKKQPEISKRAIDQAVEIAPDTFWFWLHKAHVERKLGHMQSAQDAADRASAIDPQRADAQFLLAILARESGDKVNALACVNRAISISPDANYLTWRASL